MIEITSEYIDKISEAPKSSEVIQTDRKNLLQMDEVTNELTISKNISSRIICVSEDKLELILNQFCSDIEKKREFVTPLSLIITIAATLVTAKFQDRILQASVWQAIFVIVLFICIVWLVKSLVGRKASSEKTNIRTVIERIGGGNK